MKRKVLFPVITGVLCAIAVAGSPDNDSSTPLIATPSPEAILSNGEELLYEVRWTLFRIGTIRIRQRPDLKAIAYIDSYDGLPFVDLHSIYHTEMDSGFFSRWSTSIDKSGKMWTGLRYISDTTENTIIVEELEQLGPRSQPHVVGIRDTIRLQSRQFVDGLSIGFFPRLMLRSGKTVRVQTVLSGKLGTTTFQFNNKRTMQKINALDSPVRVVEVTGVTDVVGIFGLTGEFTGWFSDDDAAVPIKGKLNVLIGNVTIELIEWKRPGWSPPT
jgi:hypothetical protein